MQIKEEIWNYTNLRAKIILCLKNRGKTHPCPPLLFVHSIPLDLFLFCPVGYMVSLRRSQNLVKIRHTGLDQQIIPTYQLLDIGRINAVTIIIRQYLCKIRSQFLT